MVNTGEEVKLRAVGVIIGLALSADRREMLQMIGVITCDRVGK